jgi:hypothetical protein
MLYSDRIAVAKMQPWMNGSSVTVNRFQQVEAFWADNADSFGETQYKTVNIYSISLNSWCKIVDRLDNHISDGKVNGYYETVFAEMIEDGSLNFKTVSFDGKPWYEIDTIEDLAQAEKLLLPGNYLTNADNLVYADLFKNEIDQCSNIPPSPATTGLLNVTK